MPHRHEAGVAHGHLVHYYRPGPTEALAAAEFLALGVAEGAAVFVLTTTERRQAIAFELRGRGIDLDALVASGRAHVSEAAVAAERLRTVDPSTVFAHFVAGPVTDLRERLGAVRCYGELVDVLSADGRFDLAMSLENFWNEFVATEPNVQLLGGYDATRFAGLKSEDLLSRIADCHFVSVGGFKNLAETSEDDLLRRVTQLEILVASARVEGLEIERVEAELALTQQRLAEMGKAETSGAGPSWASGRR